MSKPKPAPEPAADRLLTVPQVAAHLQLCERTVKALIRRGELRAELVARRWRVLLEDLRAFVKSVPITWTFTENRGPAE